MRDLEAGRSKLISELLRQGMTEQQAATNPALQRYDGQIRTAQIKLKNHLLTKDTMLQADKAQSTIFGSKAITVSLIDIKAIKSDMDAVDRMKERYQVREDDYNFNYGGKEALIEYKEKEIERNVRTTARILKVDYDTIIDMAYDFEFAKQVLNEIYSDSKINGFGSSNTYEDVCLYGVA